MPVASAVEFLLALLCSWRRSPCCCILCSAMWPKACMVSEFKQLAMQAVWQSCMTISGLLQLCLGAGDEIKSRSSAMKSSVLISEALSSVNDKGSH